MHMDTPKEFSRLRQSVTCLRLQVVGTHALLSDPVQFADLGVAIIDEQHRCSAILIRASIGLTLVLVRHVSCNTFARMAQKTSHARADIHCVRALQLKLSLAPLPRMPICSKL